MVYSHQGAIYFGTSNTLVKNDFNYTQQTPEVVPSVGMPFWQNIQGNLGEADFTTMPEPM